MGAGKVLVIYTGGTFGMLPADPGNPSSPLVPAGRGEILEHVPGLGEIGVRADLFETSAIDSSDMNPDCWIGIARVIAENYADYDGFVILHGTDTMTYTASALSFLLENLGKPVILTGSQLPAGLPRSDAAQNLVTSLMIAAPESFDLPTVPEVCIFFHNVLLRGNRSRKISSSDYRGFDSPNCGVLGRAGERIEINRKPVRKPPGMGFFINENLEKNVLAFDIFPGLRADILKKLMAIEGLKGLILKTYGAGNTPTDRDFLNAIEYGTGKKGLAVVNVTQCNEGMVEMGRYHASAGLLRLGVISGLDMTPEAALTKLQFLLGQGYDVGTVRELMQRNLRGEQSAELFSLIFESGEANPVCKSPFGQFPPEFDRDTVESAVLRIDAARLSENNAGEIELAVFLNYPNAADAMNLECGECLAIPQCLGILKKTVDGSPVDLVLDCGKRTRRVATPGRPAQVTIVSRTKQTVKWDNASMMVCAGNIE